MKKHLKTSLLNELLLIRKFLNIFLFNIMSDKKVKVTYKGETRNIPERYVKGLKGYERRKQIASIFEGKQRPKTSAPTKRSSWVEKFEKKYGKKITDTEWISKNLISKKGIKLIKDKGSAAYFTSGSRPNVNMFQWNLARLASVLLFGPAFKIDKNIAEKYGKKKWLDSK